MGTIDFKSIALFVLLFLSLNSSGQKKPLVLVDEMPVFPGCEGEETSELKQECTNWKLMKFVNENVIYPKEAKEQKVQGTAVVSFVVTEDGTIANVSLLRDPGIKCGEEALRVVRLMNEEELIWTPGKQAGEVVPVIYNLPIRFRFIYSAEILKKDRKTLAKTYSNNDFTKSLELANEILNSNPESGAAYFYRALSNYNLGKRNLVCDDLSKANHFGYSEGTEMLKILCGN